MAHFTEKKPCVHVKEGPDFMVRAVGVERVTDPAG
jgi:hypothetical protein